MILVLTILVRDEIDIIESMIEFHLAHGVDHIIITDNGSTDGTYEVCEAYQRQGLVELLYEPPSDFSQQHWVSRMANMAYTKYQADWVINADADELFVPARHHCNLKDVLNKVPDNVSVLSLDRHDFVPTIRPMKTSPHIEMVYRKLVSHNLRGIPLPPKTVHRGSNNTKVSQGNHSVTGDSLGEPHITEEISVYHYPIRSYQQFFRSVNNAGSSYATNIELNPEIGFHKRYWYQLLLKGELRSVYDHEYMFDNNKLNYAVMNNIIIEDRRIVDIINTRINETFKPVEQVYTIAD